MTEPLRRLLVFVAPYRRQYAIGLVSGVVGTAVQLAVPWVLKHAIDDLLVDVRPERIRVYAVVLVALTAGGGLFRFFVRRVLIGASSGIEYDVRNAFFVHLLHMPLPFFQARRTGDLMSRATNDLGAVRMMIGPAVVYTASTSLTFVVALMLMLSIHVRLTLLALLPFPFVALAIRYVGRAIQQRFARIQEQLADASAVTQEGLSGVRVVRAYRQEAAESRRFRASYQECVERHKTLIRLQSAFSMSMSVFMGLSALLMLWLGSREVVAGRLTVGELVALNSYLTMLSWPIMAFGWVANQLQRGMTSWTRMLEVLDVPPAIDDAGATGARVTAGHIEIRHLTFQFGDANPRASTPVLADISAVFPAGSTTAIVGATGSGKSTLLALLPRLYEPPSGTVFVDGVDVRHFPLAELRGAIGFVPQEAFLYGDTLAENVSFGVADGVDRPRVERVSAVARLDKDVAGFRDGYDTVIGERGITLSGGQKQRTALARALAVAPRILILDDALSAVDTATEEEILRGLRGVMRERTSIIVSHRVSTVCDADQILVLDGGRIVERGRHDELVEHGGVYAGLYRQQLLEDELAAP